MTFWRIAATKNKTQNKNIFSIAGKISGPLTIAKDIAVENRINDNRNHYHLSNFH